MDIFKRKESSVQCYANAFPVVFGRAKGAMLYDEAGNEYIDFLSGAGSLNYGHNNPVLKKALIDYIEADGITHGLDLHTQAKARFMGLFQEHILAPRGMDYRFQFTGPTGANAVEAAFKLARKVTGRNSIVTFTNGFHGVTLGAVAATGNRHHRQGAGVALHDVQRMPFCGYHGNEVDTIRMMERLLDDPSSGIDKPAAVVVETVQGEGGLNVASDRWLKQLEGLCRRHGMLLIVDDIQAGCGRTGTFFSFESSGISPDMVTLSKSLSGYGLPMALLLLKPELDIWKPGEHNGTFRGNNHAFITAAQAVETYWADEGRFSAEINHKANILRKRLAAVSERVGNTRLRVKGRGLMQGLECRNGEIADAISRRAFEKGLVIETSGNRGQVLKCLCPLTVSDRHLEAGLDRLDAAVADVLEARLHKVS